MIGYTGDEEIDRINHDNAIEIKKLLQYVLSLPKSSRTRQDIARLIHYLHKDHKTEDDGDEQTKTTQHAEDRMVECCTGRNCKSGTRD